MVFVTRQALCASRRKIALYLHLANRNLMLNSDHGMKTRETKLTTELVAAAAAAAAARNLLFHVQYGN